MKKFVLMFVLVLAWCSSAFAQLDDNRQAIVIQKENLAQLAMARFSHDPQQGHRVAIAYRSVKNPVDALEGPVYADCIVRGVTQDDEYTEKKIRLPMTRNGNNCFTSTEFLSTGLLCEFDGTYLDYITEIRVKFIFSSTNLKDEQEYRFYIEDLSQVLYSNTSSEYFPSMQASKVGFGPDLAGELLAFFAERIMK
ncbi:MAG TPA: hypothetical protein PKM25_07785, partial [Candidatus Ozemobacteraceae bacterium]|nr:hypothetical protein [Candidatus Ozemobacteraceae bacterium]